MTVHFWPKHTMKFICGRIPKPQDKYVFNVGEVTCKVCLEKLSAIGVKK